MLLDSFFIGFGLIAFILYVMLIFYGFQAAWRTADGRQVMYMLLMTVLTCATFTGIGALVRWAAS